MTYQEFLKAYVKQVQKPKYYEDHYYGTIYGKDKTIPIELVIRRKTSKNLSFIIRESI